MLKRKQSADIPALVEASHLNHIAFIMDGNGRWAKKRSLMREAGHREGAAAFKKVVRHCGDVGIKVVTVYAFSTENWSRPAREVGAIMQLLDEYIKGAEDEEAENKIRFYFLGDKSGLGDELSAKCDELEMMTEKYNEKTLNIALNYGGRAEIVHAVNELIAEGVSSVTDEDIARHLYTSHCADPDLIVRTAGEYRLSNFLMWQSAYSELYVTDCLWPDFREKEVDAAIIEFSKRQRRYGGV